MKGIATDEQGSDSEILDLGHALSRDVVALAPEAIRLELPQRQHSLFFCHIETSDQVLVVKKGLTTCEVEIAPRESELLELAKQLAEMLDRHDGALARATVLIAVRASCIAAVGQQDARRFPLGEFSPPKLVHQCDVRIGEGSFHFAGLLMGATRDVNIIEH